MSSYKYKTVPLGDGMCDVVEACGDSNSVPLCRLGVNDAVAVVLALEEEYARGMVTGSIEWV